MDDIRQQIKAVFVQIRQQLKQNKISSFNFSDPALNQRMPFALIGSDTKILRTDGGSFRGRKYPWGVVNIENEVHTDHRNCHGRALTDVLPPRNIVIS